MLNKKFKEFINETKTKLKVYDMDYCAFDDFYDNEDRELMNELRKVMLENAIPNIPLLLLWLVIGIILCIIGVHVIHKNENSYAKVI